MKKVYLFALSFLIIYSACLLSACNKKGCTTFEAQNFDKKAKSDDGSCTFLTDAFTHKFIGKEICSDLTEDDQALIITRNEETSDQLILNNLTRFAISPVAKVSGNSLVIENQNHQSGFLNVIINGAGTLTGNNIVVNYVTTTNNEVLECSYTGTK